MITIDQIERAFQLLENINPTSALVALRTGDIDTDFQTVEDVLSVVAVFVPEAGELKLLIEVLAAIVHGYETGAIKSAAVEDPAMQHAAGDRPAGMGR